MESIKNRKVSVCILNYKAQEILELCLQSIFMQQGDFELEVLVTDNESTDGTPEMIRNKFPEATVKVSRENRRFTVSYNEMIREATGDYIAVVNNDIELVGDRLIEAALEILDKSPAVGMIAPKSVKPNGEIELISKQELTFKEILYKWTFIGPLFMRINGSNHMTQELTPNDISHNAEVLQDSFIILRREAIDTDCLYDEKFRYYFTEDDIAIRLRRKGWKLLYSTEIQVKHRHQYSTKKISKIKFHWIYFMDVITYSRKFCGKYRSLFIFEPLAYITLTLRIIYWYMTGKAKW